jgi:hypothetical protein
MTFFRVAGEQPAHHGDGKQRVVMPLNPAFKSNFAQPRRNQPVNGKLEEEPNFSSF